MSNTNARLDALEAGLARIEALLLADVDAKAPAKVTKARKGKAQPKADAKVTKGAQTRETLSRKEWNRTLTAKAKLAGKYDNGESVYSYVIANWDEAQVARDAGMTPDEFLAQF